ncbi:MAG: tRNA (adenosine(37)-N6)-threonylcarbamoyltransferase complex transferase subunit TsaD [Candidatus Gracilibacteria bacterium]|nr:tRNA (adenosine(37)-N6)-threonylcarbamoyltransferase complex transferase subunit TsaD [Candidatus Gracilibacteria bacterium]
MYLLAFETSCDDTSIAIFRNRELIAMKTRSQIREHNETKGVVPEVAARLHANNIFGVLEEVLKEANITLNGINKIACTESPGLMPSLLVGISVAKTLAKTLKIPYIPIDHIEAHMFANYIDRETTDITFPSICLTVSGGHNELYLWKSMFEREKIGETLDDSAGEAFDKVAKMMELGYPGGPIIGKLASEHTSKFQSIFPKVLLDKNNHNFSFSGLKSAVKREIDKRILDNTFLSEQDIREIAFEFEQTVVNILSYKLFHAAEKYNISSIVLAGGVSANDRLRETIEQIAKEKGYSFLAPISKVYSQDNAAMVGILGQYKTQKIPN